MLWHHEYLTFSVDLVLILILQATLAIILNLINVKLGIVINHPLKMCAETFFICDIYGVMWPQFKCSIWTYWSRNLVVTYSWSRNVINKNWSHVTTTSGRCKFKPCFWIMNLIKVHWTIKHLRNRSGYSQPQFSRCLWKRFMAQASQ